MKRKATIVVVLAVLLAVGLWGGNEWKQERTKTQSSKSELEQWGGTPPIFRSQPVSELYIVQPVDRKLDQVKQSEDAQKLLDELGKYPVDHSPSLETKYGLLLKSGDDYYSYYIKDSTASDKLMETHRIMEDVLERTTSLVDVFSLVLPAQIESIQFAGTNMASNADPETRRALSLETTDQHVISQVMSVLRFLRVSSMDLREAEERFDLSGIEKTDGYHIILNLGKAYEYQSIEILGSRYGFTVDIPFQAQQRFYVTEYGPIKAMLDGIEKLAATKVTSLSTNQAGPSSIPDDNPKPSIDDSVTAPSQQEPAESEPRLPVDDVIPLPEGFLSPGETATP